LGFGEENVSALKLSPTEKVAILLMALGEDIAGEVFRNLHESEVRRIGVALGRLGRVDQATVDIVIQEFLAILNTKTTGLHQDGVTFAQRAIELAFKGEQGDTLSRAVKQQAITLRCLDAAESPILARILQNEHPQTIAMVLAHARPEKASALLKHWSESMRTEVLMRVANLNPIDPEVILEVDQHILKEIERMGSSSQRKLGGPKSVASILNLLHQDGTRLLEGIEERQPDLAQAIREQMFTFDDLVLLDSRGIQEIIKWVPRQQLAMALRGAGEPVKDLFFQNMSERSAKLLREDISMLGQQKINDIQKVQSEILAYVRKLEEDGKIVIDRDHRQVS